MLEHYHVLHKEIPKELAITKLSQAIPLVNHERTTCLLFSNELP